MTVYCPRTCSRLATAAVFLAIGVIQAIAGLILLKSKYVYLLSGPNFWTAAANVAVGSLLGISATLWKTVDKKSKHRAKRNLLAALVTSVIILNGTTAMILTVGESSSLISIKLESGQMYGSTTLASEILAYAYATSICAPVICIVVSIAFLTGMCFKTKNRRKSLDFKKVLDQDSSQMYSWVYTSRLPKPDPEVLLHASSSSESEESSSDSDTDSSALIPVQQRSYIRNSTELYNTRFQTSSSPSSLQCRMSKKQSMMAPVHYSPSRTVSFEDEFNLNKSRTPLSYKKVSDKYSDKIIDGRRVSVFSKSEHARKKQKMSSDTSKSGFNYDSKETPFRSVIASPYGREVFEDHKTPRPMKRLESLATTDFNRKINNLKQVSPNDASLYEDVPLHSPNTSMDIIDETGHHGKLLRTSTADHSKTPEKVQFLENSGIFPDSAFSPEEMLNKSLSYTKGNTTLNSEFQTSVTAEDSFAGEIVPISLKNASFNSNHISKLVPVSTPVISDGFKYVMATDKGVSAIDKITPYSKTNKVYRSCSDHNETNLSSFKGRDEGEENSKILNLSSTSVVSKSHMESMNQSPTNRMTDSFLPSTSTHTSGYLSAAEDESANESDSESASNQKNEQSIRSTINKSFGPKKQNRYSKRKLHTPDHSESFQTSFKNVVEQFMQKNPHTTSQEISEVLQEHLI